MIFWASTAAPITLVSTICTGWFVTLASTVTCRSDLDSFRTIMDLRSAYASARDGPHSPATCTPVSTDCTCQSVTLASTVTYVPSAIGFGQFSHYYGPEVCLCPRWSWPAQPCHANAAIPSVAYATSIADAIIRPVSGKKMLIIKNKIKTNMPNNSFWQILRCEKFK